MKILIIGANGMLGNACVNYFGASKDFEVFASIRSEKESILGGFKSKCVVLPGVDITNEVSQRELFKCAAPDVVINCVGVVKQRKESEDTFQSILINALLPHQLARSCSEYGAKLIHISTDCVFSGTKGIPYNESDASDAYDLYGKSKFLGEISSNPNVLTLRTSIIGNELGSNRGLLEWFLSQNGECQGYTEAIFSGVPTLILAQAIESALKAQPKLSGLFQVASEPISKYNLLELIAQVFGKKIKMIPNADLVINRALDGSKFRDATGFIVPSWAEMIEKMYKDRIVNVQK